MRIALLFALLALLSATAAQASIRKVSFTDTARRGGWASLRFVSVPQARCKITIIHHVGRIVLRSEGRVHDWRWMINRREYPGLYPVRVDCGESGKLLLYLRIV